MVPTTQWNFDQVALRFLCGSDIIIFTFGQNNIKGRPILNSRATCHMADSTLEESGDHVRQSMRSRGKRIHVPYKVIKLRLHMAKSRPALFSSSFMATDV